MLKSVDRCQQMKRQVTTEEEIDCVTSLLCDIWGEFQHSAECSSFQGTKKPPRKKRKCEYVAGAGAVRPKKKNEKEEGDLTMLWTSREERPREEEKIFRSVADRCLACIVDCLSKGFDVVGLRDESQYSPIMLAVEVGDAEVVRLLIEAGSDLTARNVWGETALFLAVSHYGRHTFEIVRLLLDADRSIVDVPSNDGWSPVFRVAGRFQETPATVSVLVELIHANARLDVEGRDDDVMNGRPMTSFELAVTLGNFQLGLILYESGCSVAVIHSWMRNKNFPRSLRANRKWLEMVVSMATQPKSLQDQCRLKVCQAVRSNNQDVRKIVYDLGLPRRLAEALFLDRSFISNQI